MTSDENPVHAPKRRRMAGYTPLTTEHTDGESVADIGDASTFVDKAQVEEMDLPADEAPHERVQRESATEHAPARKRRMGSASPAAEAQEVEALSNTSADAAQTGLVTPTATASPSTRLGGTKGAAGSVPPNRSTVARSAWRKPAVITAVLLVLGLLVVLGARWLRTLDGVQDFLMAYDGHAWQPEVAPDGIPPWLGWQHFLNLFFIVLIIRTGLQVRTERRPPGYWTAKKDSFFSPKGNSPKKVSLSQWLHQSLDVLWVANGMIFFVLLFVSGQWMRIVPMSWDVFPNMLSAAIQYASLDWPAENGWLHYNALQVMAYFLTVFVAAPLAVMTGVRISTWWPERAERLTKLYPVGWARALHFPVMLYFVGFTVVHVFLVFFTGALRNLNHIYGSRDVVDWWGLAIFLVSVLVIAAAWFLTRPLFTTPIAARLGKVTK
ncbi:cytochrome b/b6 domain-containing protein [Paenarthrobacter sp. YIM B13468]|uniref:cytochrome b/b6 domain-containing protein n=1 Tax=Paenarthrobacter sp. YIM B13468 TaxID=3366295 RepID=UPI00366E52E6